MRIRRLNHSVYQVLYHVVWGTKYRRKILKSYVRTDLIRSIYKLLKKHQDWYMFKINTGEDHVHILMEIPPKYRISDVVRELKTYTSIGLSSKYKFIRKIFPQGSIWSVGYFISTVGLNEEIIKKYIMSQNSYDTGIDASCELS